jgi:hypothetical protein
MMQDHNVQTVNREAGSQAYWCYRQGVHPIVIRRGCSVFEICQVVFTIPAIFLNKKYSQTKATIATTSSNHLYN